MSCDIIVADINPLSTSVALIETSRLIFTANQFTGFYMKATLALNGLNAVLPYTATDWTTQLLLDKGKYTLHKGTLY